MRKYGLVKVKSGTYLATSACQRILNGAQQSEPSGTSEEALQNSVD